MQRPTAAVIVIGDEILNGRIADSNIHTIGNWLSARGVRLKEARIVSDEPAHIIEAVNALRSVHSYVFTTGGIGPTHDDKTADAVAAAFGVSIDVRADALERLRIQYKSDEALTDARLRMARIPEGAKLIDNPVTAAPGFQIENVFVMAGVPKIMAGMLEGLDDRIVRTEPQAKASVTSAVAESRMADTLAALEASHPGVEIGSYPFLDENGGGRGVTIVVRSDDPQAVQTVLDLVAKQIEALGGTPEFRDHAQSRDASV